MESKCIGVFFYDHSFKSGGREAGSKCNRLDGNQSVSDMNHSHDPTLEAVAADEDSSRP